MPFTKLKQPKFPVSNDVNLMLSQISEQQQKTKTKPKQKKNQKKPKHRHMK